MKLCWVSCLPRDPRGPLNPPRSLCPGRFWFRLYWFPLKVLYATCYSSLQSVPNIPFYFFFNALLLILTLMNIYWFLVSRGELSTPCATFSLLCRSGTAPAARLPLGAAGGLQGWRRLRRSEGRRETRVGARRGSSALEFRLSHAPGDPRGGGDNSSRGRLGLGVGVNALASPEALGRG